MEVVVVVLIVNVINIKDFCEQIRDLLSRLTIRFPTDSAIGQHLLDNPDCAKLYNDDMFQIIGRARSSFHLAILGSIYIQTKKPPLCRQKEFVSLLELQW